MPEMKQTLNRNAIAVEMYTTNPAVDTTKMAKLDFDSDHPDAVATRALAYEYTDDLLRALSTLPEATDEYVTQLKFEYTMMFVMASTDAAGAFYI